MDNVNYTENRDKGLLFAQTALKKLEEGNIEGFKKDWQIANENLDLYLNSVGAEAGNMALFGENYNFGIIYNVIEGNSNLIYEDKKRGPKIYKALIKEIRSNKQLKEQFDVYNALVRPVNVTDAKTYVNEVFALAEDLKKSDVRKSNRKLIGIMQKGQLDEMIDIPDEMIDLYENIEFVLFNKNKFDRLSGVITAKDRIVEYVEKANKTVDEDKPSYDEQLSEMVKKYDDELNEDEKALIEQVSNGNGEAMFNEAKDTVISAINNNLNAYNGEDRKELENILEQMKDKIYNENTVLQDIAKMTEVMNIVNE